MNIRRILFERMCPICWLHLAFVYLTHIQFKESSHVLGICQVQVYTIFRGFCMLTLVLNLALRLISVLKVLLHVLTNCIIFFFQRTLQSCFKFLSRI